MLQGDTVRRVLDSGIGSVVLSLNAPDAASFEGTNARLNYKSLVRHIQDFVVERYRRGLSKPRIEIQLLNSTSSQIPGCRLVENSKQVQSQIAFWTKFVRRLEREHSAVGPPASDATGHLWPRVLENRQANDPDTYFTLGNNLFLTFKPACNFANTLLPADAAVQETQYGRCQFGNAHRVLAIYWDGSCSFCSLDFDKEMVVGNVFDEGVEAIWRGSRMRRIRALMEHNILAEPLCRRCLGNVYRNRVKRFTEKVVSAYE